MYVDLSTGDYPKTLLIRNEPDGLIWQIYHVQAIHEVERLSSNATKNGFRGITLVNYQPGLEETWPDWRGTRGGQKIINNEP